MDLHKHTGRRVLEAQTFGVQPISGVAGQGGPIVLESTSGGIERIAHQRIPHRSQVDADLVRPSGVDLHFNQRARTSNFQDVNSTERPFARTGCRVNGPQLRMRDRTDGDGHCEGVLIE